MDYKRIEHLVEAFRNGDKNAFDKLYSTLYKNQLNFATSMVRDRYAAEDIVQDSFMYAYSNMDSLNNPRAFVSWFNRIVYCNCAGSLKSSAVRKSKEVNIDEYLYPEEAADVNLLSASAEKDFTAKEKRIDVQKAVQSLDFDTQVLLYLRFHSGYKEAEIAEIMKVPVGTVKSRLSSTKKKLKNSLSTAFSWNPFFFLWVHYLLAGIRNHSIAGLHCGSHALKNAVLFPVAAIGVSVGAAVYAGSLPPVISSIRLADYKPASVNQTVDVEVESSDGIRNVYIRESGEPFEGDGKIFRTTLNRNGIYDIVAEDQNGKTDEKAVSIANIDADYPDIEDPEVLEDKISLGISDAASGIDWDKISAVNTDGKKVEIVPDRRKGEIVCKLSDLPLNIRISDMAGNWQSVNVSYE